MNEDDYTNADGRRLKWRLKEILTLDSLEAQNLDEIEVLSRSIAVPKQEYLPFDVVLTPEKSQPVQTVSNLFDCME